MSEIWRRWRRTTRVASEAAKPKRVLQCERMRLCMAAFRRSKNFVMMIHSSKRSGHLFLHHTRRRPRRRGAPASTLSPDSVHTQRHSHPQPAHRPRPGPGAHHTARDQRAKLSGSECTNIFGRDIEFIRYRRIYVRVAVRPPLSSGTTETRTTANTRLLSSFRRRLFSNAIRVPVQARG